MTRDERRSDLTDDALDPGPGAPPYPPEVAARIAATLAALPVR